ncbi:MAG: hypothetical protein FRX49_00450 [Trebouxia sp. A1-2]|nr:MAG: hypothetical protein FRX49_00450 [Trebouxia sp. A1-2]
MAMMGAETCDEGVAGQLVGAKAEPEHSSWHSRMGYEVYFTSHGCTPGISLSGGAPLGPGLEDGNVWEAGPLLGPPFIISPLACIQPPPGDRGTPAQTATVLL